MDITAALEELENSFNSFAKKFSDEEIEKFTEYVTSEFNTYSGIIRNFFTGKEDEIKNIYYSIRTNKYPYNKIKSVDVVQSRHMYLEYSAGMTEYMLRMTDLKNTDNVNVNTLSDNIALIRERDELFILSIFGGDKNPPIDEDLNSSMKNIEVLIDTNSDFNVFKTNISNLVNKYNSTDELYKSVVSKAVTVYVRSVRQYIYYCMKTILNCYMDIQDSLKSRTPVTPPKETPEYQMF